MMKKTVITGLIMVWLCGCSGDMADRGNTGRLATGEGSVKVLVIGFDGGTWDMFKPAVELGKMPRLQNLIKQGAYSELETIVPTLTPVIWTTIATGRLPEDHGVKAVVEVDPVTREIKPLTSQSSRVKPVWHILSEEKKEVSIVRWPLTWPVESVNGEIVSDYAFQTTRLHRTWPGFLAAKVDTFTEQFTLHDIVDLTGVNRENYQKLDPFWQWKLMVLLREFQLDVQFKNVAQSLFKQNQRDFSAVYFYSLDALGHNFYQFLKPVPERPVPDFSGLVMNWCGLYDRFLSDILDAVDPETYVIICSDHGMNLTLEPQKFLVLSEDTPPEKLGEPQEVALPPGPSFDTDPFSVTLHYTAPSGEHSRKPDGIFLIAGPEVIKGRKVPRVHITDILPTILYVMDLPVSDEFAGEPRLDLFNTSFTSGRDIKRIESYETEERVSAQMFVKDYEDEDDLLLNRLQALGYIK